VRGINWACKWVSNANLNTSVQQPTQLEHTSRGENITCIRKSVQWSFSLWNVMYFLHALFQEKQAPTTKDGCHLERSLNTLFQQDNGTEWSLAQQGGAKGDGVKPCQVKEVVGAVGKHYWRLHHLITTDHKHNCSSILHPCSQLFTSPAVCSNFPPLGFFSFAFTSLHIAPYLPSTHQQPPFSHQFKLQNTTWHWDHESAMDVMELLLLYHITPHLPLTHQQSHHFTSVQAVSMPQNKTWVGRLVWHLCLEN